MEFVWSVITFIGQAIEAVLSYVEHHHWVFAFLAGGYVFYLHDRSVHARFDAPSNIDRPAKPFAISARNLHRELPFTVALPRGFTSAVVVALSTGIFRLCVAAPARTGRSCASDHRSIADPD